MGKFLKITDKTPPREVCDVREGDVVLCEGKEIKLAYVGGEIRKGILYYDLKGSDRSGKEEAFVFMYKLTKV